MFFTGGACGNIHTTYKYSSIWQIWPVAISTPHISIQVFDKFIDIWKTSYHSLWNRRKSFHFKSNLDVAPVHGSHCHGAMFICSWILVCIISHSVTWPSWRCVLCIATAVVIAIVVAVTTRKYMGNPDQTGKKLIHGWYITLLYWCLV